mmetsp:Transcript_56941/g.126957  ORF Transcript_56941/g.126957 Transcript_56941/m.126957 type:complete len:249 (+) Transcript_56941:186-932(+)
MSSAAPPSRQRSKQLLASTRNSKAFSAPPSSSAKSSFPRACSAMAVTNAWRAPGGTATNRPVLASDNSKSPKPSAVRRSAAPRRRAIVQAPSSSSKEAALGVAAGPAGSEGLASPVVSRSTRKTPPCAGSGFQPCSAKVALSCRVLPPAMTLTLATSNSLRNSSRTAAPVREGLTCSRTSLRLVAAMPRTFPSNVTVSAGAAAVTGDAGAGWTAAVEAALACSLARAWCLKSSRTPATSFTSAPSLSA